MVASVFLRLNIRIIARPNNNNITINNDNDFDNADKTILPSLIVLFIAFYAISSFCYFSLYRDSININIHDFRDIHGFRDVLEFKYFGHWVALTITYILLTSAVFKLFTTGTMIYFNKITRNLNIMLNEISISKWRSVL